MRRCLFLDDIRMPGDVTWLRLPSVEWDIVRSYDDAIEWVLKNGFPDMISFDHDLGYEEWETNNTIGIVVVTSAKEEKSGYDFAKWLIGYDIDTGLMSDNFSFSVHSMNPVGVINITELMNNYIKFKENNK